MRKALLVLLLSLAALPASAGTLTLTVVVGANTFTKTYTDTNANFTRLLNVYVARCTAAAQAKITDGSTAATCTNSQAATFYFESIVAGSRDAVTVDERSAAVTTAAGTIVPINPQ